MTVKAESKKKKKKPVLLGGFVEVTAMPDGVFYFNPPTNQEWSEWRKAATTAESAEDWAADLVAYAKLFDQTFEKADNLIINNTSNKAVKLDKTSIRFLSDRDKKEVIQAGFVLTTRFVAGSIKN